MNALCILFYLFTVYADLIDDKKSLNFNMTLLNNTRRILGGKEAGDTRPYMVYLRSAAEGETHLTEINWLCGGVIIHERYILTSAACIEDAKRFYVVSGTHKWTPPAQAANECIKNGAKRAVWKCVPKSYFFDGKEFDNIRWMIKDIAVVKVEDDFNFKRRIRGCDFIPKKIAYNNISVDLEKAGTVGFIAGWGSTDAFEEATSTRQTKNSPILLETDVRLISKKNCKSRWDERYHHIIDAEMICGRNTMDAETMSALCSDQVDCKELIYSEEEYPDQTRRLMLDPQTLTVHTADHYDPYRRTKVAFGGFCENDHGGPLIVGRGKSAVVVGVMSACLTKDITRKCHGPFLYTSVWKNRHLINCAIHKEMEPTCRRLLRSTKTQLVEMHFNWANVENGTETVYGKTATTKRPLGK